MEKHRLPDTPFWVEPESVGPDHLELSLEESHHLLHVHRAKPGAPFQATNGEGDFFECVLESVKRHSAVGRIVEHRAEAGELSRGILVLVGMPDRRGIEQVVEHAVPLGASALDFIPCDRSASGALGPQRLVRLERIARAALKQSRRSRLPRLGSSRSLAAGVGALAAGGKRYFADPKGKPFVPLRLVDSEAAAQLAVGPPGGFSEDEREFLLQAGFLPISLGPSRLTTETAVLTLMSLVRNCL